MADTPTPDATATNGSGTPQRHAKLKACPFCGGRADFMYPTHRNGRPQVFAVCVSCGIQTARVGIARKSEVVNAWNRRATP